MSKKVMWLDKQYFYVKTGDQGIWLFKVLGDEAARIATCQTVADVKIIYKKNRKKS